MAKDNPDIVVLKVDFDENRDIVKPLAIKVGHGALLAPHMLHCVCRLALCVSSLEGPSTGASILPLLQRGRGASCSLFSVCVKDTAAQVTISCWLPLHLFVCRPTMLCLLSVEGLHEEIIRLQGCPGAAQFPAMPV